MDAMILAAGVGSRLGEITAATPKALVEVGGEPVLEHVARRLIAAGADRLIINIHHHADQIVRYVESRGHFGVEVCFSREQPSPLETGGGVLHAAPWFRRDSPILLHNVDVLSQIDLADLYRMQLGSDALATLAVQHRPTSRYLLFDVRGLCGRFDRRGQTDAETTGMERFAFAGVHAISPALLDRMSERGTFSIMDVYLRLAAEGERIAPYDIGDTLWLEIGSPERLAAARAHFDRQG